MVSLLSHRLLFSKGINTSAVGVACGDLGAWS